MRAEERFEGSMEQSSMLKINFEPELNLMLCRQADEVSAFRLRKRWKDILQDYFLLEEQSDFVTKVEQFNNEACWSVICSFETASGRYAFWRMINNHVPEVIEKLQGKEQKKQKLAQHLRQALGAISFSSDQKEELEIQEREESKKGVIYHLFG